MRTTMIALTALVLAAPAAGSQGASQGGAASSEGGALGKERKYCIQYEDYTGSRTGAKQECKTKAQWARKGVQVDKLGKD